MKSLWLEGETSKTLIGGALIAVPSFKRHLQTVIWELLHIMYHQITLFNNIIHDKVG